MDERELHAFIESLRGKSFAEVESALAGLSEDDRKTVVDHALVQPPLLHTDWLSDDPFWWYGDEPDADNGDMTIDPFDAGF